MYAINLHLSSYISSRSTLNNSVSTFLVDTGADISIFKKSHINQNVFIDTSTVTRLNGIGHGTVSTLGMVSADLILEDLLVRHDFHVVEDNFPIPCSGILGLDFFKKYNCVLDYQTNQDWIIIRSKDYHEDIAIPMSNSFKENTISIPARSEVIRLIHIESTEEEIFIPHQEIKTGVYIANTITSRNQPFVKIANTLNENITIQNVKVKTESLNDYNIIHSIQATGNSEEKLNKLRKHFPKFAYKALNNLCSNYLDIFALETEPITTNTFYKQKLRMKDDEPVYIKNYRIPQVHKEEISRQLGKLIKDDIVEPSTSEYNSPILLVPKKPLPGKQEKRWRLVIDYRAINKKLMADKFPLPRIDDILDQLGRAKYFSCLDLTSGFHQIELSKESRDITSFTADGGTYRFKRLPYGLKIAPNSFQRMMTLAFAGLKPSQAFLYMDDLVVLGCSEKHMIKNLEDVFDTCRKYNLKLHPDKCIFFNQEVTYLGHKCTNKGILPDPSKFETVQKYPVPKNADEAKRFVAFCNYYRRFVPNFAEHSRILTRLCRKNVPFDWTEECTNAFQYLKKSLISPQILQYPDFSKEFYITTDASGFACGAVLSQKYEDKQLPIAYGSRAFTKGEINKATIEKELAAIHWAITFFRPYVYGRKFFVKTDHRPLTYLFSMRNPSSKLMRIRLDLEEYDFEVEYIAGKENYIADALSRINITDLKQLAVESNKVYRVTTRAMNKHNPYTVANDISHHENPKIYEALNKYEVRKHAQLIFDFPKMYIKKGKKICSYIDTSNLIVETKIDLGQFFVRLMKEAGKLGLVKIQLSLGDKLFKYTRVDEFKEKGTQVLKGIEIALTPELTQVTDVEKINEIIRQYHDDPIRGGHPGIVRTTNKIRQHFYWKNMKKDIKNYVTDCKQCKKNKINRHIREPMVITETPRKAFETVQIDTIGPLPKSLNGNEYAVTIICDLTKYFIAVPIPTKHAKTIARAIFENYILVYGCMKTMLTDMGTEYKNSIFEELCQLLKVEHKTSTPYHHQTLGTVERSHRTFNEYVRSYISIDKSDWDEYLKYFCYCYNTTPSTVHGYCPFELVFGKTPPTFNFLEQNEITPLYNYDAYDKELKYRLQVAQQRAKEYITKRKEKQKTIYDRKIQSKEISIGDLVLVKDDTGHKLDSRYKGPFRVESIDKNNNYSLVSNDTDNDKLRKQKISKNIVIHKNRLKLID